MDKQFQEKLINLNSIIDEDFNLPYFKKSLKKGYVKEIYIRECIKEKKFYLIEKALKNKLINKRILINIVSLLEINKDISINEYITLLEIENSLIFIPEVCKIEYIDIILKNEKIEDKRKIEYIWQLRRNTYYSDNYTLNLNIVEKILDNYPNNLKITRKINLIINEINMVKKILDLEIQERNNLINKLYKSQRFQLLVSLSNQIITETSIDDFIKYIEREDNSMFNTAKVLNNIKPLFKEQIKLNRMLENF